MNSKGYDDDENVIRNWKILNARERLDNSSSTSIENKFYEKVVWKNVQKNTENWFFNLNETVTLIITL